MRRKRLVLILSTFLASLIVLGCASEPDLGTATEPATSFKPPSILLITLDTTRADALESDLVDTPNFDTLRSRGQVFNQAYTTAPMTLPAHASILTGLLPIDHGIHENARYLSADHPLLAEELRQAGYQTAAFISGYPLDASFGLARGFDHYDDDLAEAPERRAEVTTDRALAWLAQQTSDQPTFVWVHYFDPHEPYDPPEPFRTRYEDHPYRGEIAYLDQEFGRLLAGVEQAWADRPHNLLTVGDHGESLGEHGEALHGHLLYQATMRVPLILSGSNVEPKISDRPVSALQVFDTILHWATGTPTGESLLLPETRPSFVLGEAMKPFFQYGWQPQIMAVEGRLKMIHAGAFEVYDVLDDPAEAQNLAAEKTLGRASQEAIRDYRERILADGNETAAEPTLSAEDREKLASLGYVGWSGSAAPLREDAPAARDMSPLFDALDAGSGAFQRQDYERAIEIFSQIADQDPHNLMVALRLAVAQSVLDRPAQALEAFERARGIAPQSTDVRHYLGMHYFRNRQWSKAAALFESVLASEPRRLPALRSLARIRQLEQDLPRAITLLERVIEQEPEAGSELVQLGEMKMALGDTDGAIKALERARDLSVPSFDHFLELGVLYLANQDFDQARDHLDQVRSDHPGRAMALFKRAQVSVLLGEADRLDRIRQAYAIADETTRALIERESLFQNLSWR